MMGRFHKRSGGIEMFCPNCASPIDNVKFCRACGANVSLVPVALSGQLQATEEEEEKGGRRRHRRNRKQPSVEGAWKSIFVGFGFLAVAFAVSRYFPGGGFWWFWLLIPAFGTLGEGVGQLFKLRSERPVLVTSATTPPAARIEAPTTSQLAPPASVIEDTTKHLEEAQRR
jgi:hypothetical protein